MGRCEIIELDKNLFFRTTIKERRFYHEARIKIRRKEAREHLAQFNLACELTKLIRHFFSRAAPIIETTPRSQTSELYHIPWRDSSYDPYSFFFILH